jgi:hypothetical protein
MTHTRDTAARLARVNGIERRQNHPRRHVADGMFAHLVMCAPGARKRRASAPHFDRRSVVSQVLMAMANLNFKIKAALIFPMACVDRDSAM